MKDISNSGMTVFMMLAWTNNCTGYETIGFARNVAITL
jgi:hypothetical protein